MIKLNIPAIQAMDLSDLAPYILDDEARGFFMAEKGEHYKLLAWLSTQFTACNIADIGTYKGASAVALSYNISNSVHSYDISPMCAVRDELPNLNFRIISPDQMAMKWLDCSLIMLDTVHDGIHERAVINWLMDNNWKGLLVLDDIGPTFPGQQALWEDIMLPKMAVPESVSHWSMTGLIEF